jgi:predicted metal-dependent hydrolase
MYFNAENKLENYNETILAILKQRPSVRAQVHNQSSVWRSCSSGAVGSL